MRLNCEGWHRNHGARELYRGSLSGADVSTKPGEIPYDRPRIIVSDRPPNRPNGGWAEIKFRIDTKGSPLNGEYLFSLRLSRSDVLKIVASALKDLTIVSFVRLIGDIFGNPDEASVGEQT